MNAIYRYRLDLSYPRAIEDRDRIILFGSAYEAAEAYDEHRGDNGETIQEIAACLSDGEGYFYEDPETGMTAKVGPA